jgi:putative spermidine/putrescine transport system permease protein
MAPPPYAGLGERTWYYGYRVFCSAILLFLILPIVIVVPLSFNVQPYFSFNPTMFGIDDCTGEFRPFSPSQSEIDVRNGGSVADIEVNDCLVERVANWEKAQAQADIENPQWVGEGALSEAYSLRWYMNIFTKGMKNTDLIAGTSEWWSDSWENSQWLHSMRNSVLIAIFATMLSASLGTLAALGLSQANMPYRNLFMGLLISPMIVPIIITSVGLFFFYNTVQIPYLYEGGLNFTILGIVLAHALLGTPFVVITVTATLMGFDQSLIRAGANCGAAPQTVFFKIVMPLILPGVISGALFAFITSFDEVVAVIFMAGYEQRTIPRQMWSGIREQINPTILSVATILVCISICLLSTVEVLRRRSERLRGLSPG